MRTFYHFILCFRLRNVKNKLVNASEAIGLSKQTPMAFILQEIGIEAEVKMNEYVQSLSIEGSSDRSSLQEVESVDAAGNVIHKRVINHNVYPEEHHQ